MAENSGVVQGRRLAELSSGSGGSQLQRAGGRLHAVGHGQDQHGHASLPLAVLGRDSEGA